MKKIYLDIDDNLVEFQSVIGYEGLYWINNSGDVLTFNWKNTGKRAILKPATDQGYKKVGLQKDGKLKTHRVHRLVAAVYIPNPDNKPMINHIDGNKANNNVSNLEWCTAKENTKHAIDNGLFHFNTSEQSANITPKRGELNGLSKLKEFEVLEIRAKFKPRKYTRKMLSIEYGVKECTIKDVVLRKSWKHI